MRKELEEIEEERKRLEKEEYLVRQSDIHFYDFDEMKAVYVARRFEVLRCLHFLGWTRGHRTMPGVVSFSSLSCFGPRRGRRGVSRVDGVFTRQRRRDAIVVIPRGVYVVKDAVDAMPHRTAFDGRCSAQASAWT